MSQLNLDTVSPYFPPEPATPALGPAGVSPTGRNSFGEHLKRARQTVGTSTNTNRPPADTARPADPKTLPATEDRPVDPKTPPATEDRPATDGDSPAVESDEDAPPRPDSGHEERDQSEANETGSDASKEIGDSETEATSDGEDRSETANFLAEAAVAAVESDPTAGNVNDDAATKSINKGEISGDPPAPEESAPVRQHEGQQNSRQSPAAPPGQQPGRSAAAGNLVPDEPQEQGRVQAETMPEENADAASRTDAEQAARASKTTDASEQPTRQVIEATVAESPDERNDGVPAASGAANSQQDGTTPQANSRGRGRQQAGGRAADRSDAIRSGEIAKDAKSAKTPPDQRQDTQAAATRPSVAADGIKAEVGDQTAEMSPTGAGEAEASGPVRLGTGQGPRPGPATQNPGNSAPDQVDRVRFVQRVARAFEAIGDRGGSIRLRLHPPELGSLRLQATIRNGVMTVRLEAETETARSILLDNLPALRDRLAAQDIKVQQFDVDLTDRSFGGSAEQPGSDPQPHDHPKDNAPNTGPDQRLETERPSQPGMAIEPGRGNQLDVII